MLSIEVRWTQISERLDSYFKYLKDIVANSMFNIGVHHAIKDAEF